MPGECRKLCLFKNYVYPYNNVKGKVGKIHVGVINVSFESLLIEIIIEILKHYFFYISLFQTVYESKSVTYAALGIICR